MKLELEYILLVRSEYKQSCFQCKNFKRTRWKCNVREIEDLGDLTEDILVNEQCHNHVKLHKKKIL